MQAGARIFVLGADGFIGRHIAFGLRARGFEVVASARRTKRLTRMGFETFQCDLSDPKAHDPAFWRAPLTGCHAVINAAGVLTASDATFDAIHVAAPKALYDAAPTACQILLLSAVGIEDAQPPFAKYRRAGEAVAQAAGALILRAGLVLGDTSYGGSSLARGLAALPFITPVIGRGRQVFNPIHASDLTDMMIDLLGQNAKGQFDVGGPEHVTQLDMLRAMRGWLGLPKSVILPVPMGIARLIGRIGDLMQLGPISATAVAQLSHGIDADGDAASALVTQKPRGFSAFLGARPAGTQDLWHARLYLMRPVLRIVLAMMWLVSAGIGLTLPSAQFLPLIQSAPMPDIALIAMARLGGVADLLIAAALLRGWRPRMMAGVQAAMVAGYTLAFTVLAPALWLLPLGGLLKNLPILALIALLAILEDER